MLWLWNFFLDRRQFSYVLIGSLVAAGVFVMLVIPKENTPAIVIPNGIVTTALPGASAEDMETLVTNKLEDQISNLSNVDTITSSSGAGVSFINVQFAASADINQSIQDLRDAVAKAESELPADATTPQVTKINFNDQPMMVISIASDLPPTEFSKLARNVSDELKTISGVSRIDIAGVPDRQVDVVVRKEALELYGLRLVDVMSAISASNAALPVGHITMNNVNYDVNFKGGITDPSQIQNIAVSSKNGVPIYVRDIAIVSDGLAPESTYSRISLAGEPSNQSVALTVYKQSGRDIQGVSNAVKAHVKELENSLLANVSVVISPSTDQGAQVSEQLWDLSRTGLETVALVVAALLLTIGWRESLVAALSIPLSFLIAFIGLQLTGNTLNFISLFALILAVGILVDSGIVVTEAIHTRMRKFDDPADAAKAALHDYAWPLIAGTMATVAVFAPLFFISGIIGKFIAGIPYTLVFVLMASIFVALGIVPLIAILFTSKREQNRLEKLQEEYTDRATHWYRNTLRKVLENRRTQNIFLRSIAGLFFLSLLLPVTGIVQTTFFPAADEDFIFINIKKPRGTALPITDLTARAVEEILYTIPDIESFQTTVGQSSSFGTELSGGSSGGSENAANVTINLPSERKRSSSEIVAELTSKLSNIKDAEIQVIQPSNGPPSGAPIQIQFIGDDLDALIAGADKGKQLLTSLPHTTNITSSTANNGTEFALTIDRAKATTLGLNAALVAQTLRAAINGSKVTSITQPDQDIDVVVKLDLNPSFRVPADTSKATLDSIRNLTIQTPSGPVLLGSVLSDSLARSNATISHKDKKRIETVSAYPDKETTANEVIAQFQERVEELQLPASVSISYGGETEDIQKSFTEMFFALIAGLVLMFLILIIEFNSIRYTLYLLMIVPLSLIGVLDGLALSGQPVSFTALLGVIALGGVIINHAIILMDSMLHHIHAEPGRPLIDLVVESSASRLRPIFLTTITTVLGMVPLARLNPTWAPLAYTVMFGLTFAIVLTLMLVPVIFYRAQLKGKK